MNLKYGRESLVNNLVRAGHLRTHPVIRAFMSVPRETFVLKEYRDYAYRDEPLPTGWGQTISAPHMVAIMTELLAPKKTDRVLEIGAGSGYQAAILSKLVREVLTVELDPRLAQLARTNLKAAGVTNVRVIAGDGWEGYPEEAPYDKIIVTCATPEFPPALPKQLKDGGIMLAPLGGSSVQMLTKAEKASGILKSRNEGKCVFVPLRRRDASEAPS